jgi:hypothetical protein
MARWERREIEWPESARWADDVMPHDHTRHFGYAGGAGPEKTSYCSVCDKRKYRRGMWEWRGNRICEDCIAQVRPVTIHATWTQLLPSDAFAEGGETEIGGRMLNVAQVAESLLVFEVEVFDDGEGRSRLIQRPSLDVWLSDRESEAGAPNPAAGTPEPEWAGQVLRDRATGAELDRNTENALQFRIGQKLHLLVGAPRGARTRRRWYVVAAIEDDGDTILLDEA